MIDELSFEIPDTPENKAAFEELKKQIADTPATLYAEDKDGNVFPVMNVTRHPDCPDGWYDEILKRFLN